MDAYTFSPLVHEALEYARKAHHKQKRRNGEPYIEHPFRVVKLLRRVGASEEVQMAGALHDVLEDTKVTAKEIEVQFGEEVRRLVEQCTKDAGGRFYISDHNAWLIKLCDGFDNCTDVEAVTEARIRRYAATKRELFGIT